MKAITCDACPMRDGGKLCFVSAAQAAPFRAAAVPLFCRPQQLLFSEGSPGAGLYVLCQGRVKLFHADRFGREFISAVREPVSLIGEFAAHRPAPHSASAVTLTEAQVYVLPRERVSSLLQRFPDMGVRLLEMLSRQLADARRKARDLALKGAEGRLAAVLAEAASGPIPARLAFPRRELAEMIGVSTETAIRMLARLKHKGVVATAGREITIRSADRLRALASRGDIEAQLPLGLPA
jgi:CRP/FNR family transcriptional regulator